MMADSKDQVNSELAGGQPDPGDSDGSSNLVHRDEWGSIADILKSIENTSRRSRTAPQGAPKRMPPLTENIQTTPTPGERGQGMQQLDHLLRLMEQMCALRRQNNKLREHAQYLTAIKTLQDIRNEQLLHDCSCEVHRNASDHSSSSSPMDHNLGNIESFSEPESHAGDDEMENRYRSNRSEKRLGRTITREPKGRSVTKRSKSLDPFGEEAEEEMVKERGRPGIFSKFEKMKEKLTNRRGSVKRRSGVKGLDEEGKRYDSELGVPTDGLETKSEDSGFYQNVGDDSSVLPHVQRFELSQRGEEEFSDGEEVFDARQPALAQRGDLRQIRKVSDVSTGSSSEDFHESKQTHKKSKSQPSVPSGSSLSDHNEDLHTARRRSRFNKSSSFQEFNSSVDTDPSPSNLPDPLPVPKRHARLEQSLSMDTEVPDVSGKLGSQSPKMGSVDSKLGQKRKHTQKAAVLDLSDPLLSSSPESRGGDQLPRSSSPPEKKRNKETKSSGGEGGGGGDSKQIPSTDMMTMYENIQANLSDDFLSKLEAWDKKKQKEGSAQDMTKQSSVESVSSEPGIIPTNDQKAELLQGLSEEFSKKLAEWDKKKKGTVGPSPKGDRKQKGSSKDKKDKSKKDEKVKSEETTSQKKVEGEKVVTSSRRVVVVENEEGLVKLEGASKDFEEKYREWERMHRPTAGGQKKKEKDEDESEPPENKYPLPAFKKVTDSNFCLATPVIVEPHLVPQSQQTKHEMASQADFPEEVVEPMDTQLNRDSSTGDEPISTLERKNSLLAEKLKQKDVNLKVVQTELQVVQEQLEKMAGWKGDEKRHSTCSSIGETSLEAELSEIKSQVQELEEKIQSQAEIRREKTAREEECSKHKDKGKNTKEAISPPPPGKLEAQVQTIQENERPTTTTSNSCTEELTKSLQQRENLIKFLQMEVERQRREINFLRSDGLGGAHFKRAKSFSARDRNFDAKAMQVMDIPLGKSLASRGKKDSPNSTPSLSNADSSDQRNRESLSITTESTQSLETLHISAEDIRMEDLGSQTLEQDHKTEEVSPITNKQESLKDHPPDMTKELTSLPDVTKDTPNKKEDMKELPDIAKPEPEKSTTSVTNKNITSSNFSTRHVLETQQPLEEKTEAEKDGIIKKEESSGSDEQPQTKGSKVVVSKQHPLDAHIPTNIVTQKISSLKSSSASGRSSDSDSKDEKIGTKRQRADPKWKVKDELNSYKHSSLSRTPKETSEGKRQSRPRTREKKTSTDEGKELKRTKDTSKQINADSKASTAKIQLADKKPTVQPAEKNKKGDQDSSIKSDTDVKKAIDPVSSKRRDSPDTDVKKAIDPVSSKRRDSPDTDVKKAIDPVSSKRRDSSDTDVKKAIDPVSSKHRDSSDSDVKKAIDRVSSKHRDSAATDIKKAIDPVSSKHHDSSDSDVKKAIDPVPSKHHDPSDTDVKKAIDPVSSKRHDSSDTDVKKAIDPVSSKHHDPSDTDVMKAFDPVSSKCHDSSDIDVKEGFHPVSSNRCDLSDTEVKKAFDPTSSKRRDSSDSVSSSRRSSPATHLLEKYDPKFAKTLASNKVEVATVSDLKAKFSGGSEKSGSKSEDEDSFKDRREKPKAGSVKMLSQAFAVSSAVTKETSKGIKGMGGGTGPSSIRSTPSISPSSSCSSLSSSHVSDRIKRLQDRRSQSVRDSANEKKPSDEIKPPSPLSKDVPKITPPLLPNKSGYRSSMPNLSAVRAKFEQGGESSGGTSGGLRVRQKSGSTGKLSFTVSVTESKTNTEKNSEVKPIRVRARPPRLVAVIETPGKDKNATETVTVRLRSPTARRSTRTSDNINNSNKQMNQLHISEPEISGSSQGRLASKTEEVSASAPSLRLTSSSNEIKPVSQKMGPSHEVDIKKPVSSSVPQIGNNPTEEKSAGKLVKQTEDESKKSSHQISEKTKSDSNETDVEQKHGDEQESHRPESTSVDVKDEKTIPSKHDSNEHSDNTSPRDKEHKSKSHMQSNEGKKGKGGKKAGGGGHHRGDQNSRKSKNGQQQQQQHEQSSSSSVRGGGGKPKAKRKNNKRAEERREQEVNSRNSLDSERHSKGNDSESSRSSLNGDNVPDLLAETPKMRDSVIIDDNGNKTRNPRQAVAASALQGAAAAIGHALPDPATRAELEDLPSEERRSRKDKTRRGRMLSKADRLSKLDLFRRARSVDTSKAPRDRSPSLERPGRSGRASSMDRSKKREKSPSGMKGKGKDGQRGGWKRILRASNDSLVDSLTDSDSLTTGSVLIQSADLVPNLHVNRDGACDITEDVNVVGSSVFYC